MWISDWYEDKSIDVINNGVKMVPVRGAQNIVVIGMYLIEQVLCNWIYQIQRFILLFELERKIERKSICRKMNLGGVDVYFDALVVGKLINEKFIEKMIGVTALEFNGRPLFAKKKFN